MNTTKYDEALQAYDQQFEVQVAMVMNGMIPHGGTSLDFIIKILKRKGYDEDRIKAMEELAPLIKEEINYLEAKQLLDKLETNRTGRLNLITDLMT